MAPSNTQRPHGTADCAFKFKSCTGPSTTLWWCVDCSARICDGCWPELPGHRDGVTARDGQPHEKADYRRHDRLREILNPPVTENELEQLHEADVATTWFGISKNRYHQPCLLDGGIYNSLIAQCPIQDNTKNPQLVSFIGQTNAGKSTLIKMLIDHAQTQSNIASHQTYATPVAGSAIHSRLPTSADVHLYADPKTYCSSTPLFYADAEGLDAGEETPMGAPSRRRSKLHGIRGGSKRILAWADTAESRERPFIVSELYPRLLYTFSDVVVFVLRNEKTFEKTGLERLIKWGAASLETSVNQPTLPKLIIAVNAATVNVETREWDVSHATENLLKSVRPSLRGKTYFRSLAQSWSAKGRHVGSMDDLIRCYYSSFSVVRVPAEGRYTLMDKQIGALRDTITSCCEDSFHTKRRANMLSNSDEFSVFLHSAFDHFARDLETPFNFIEVSLRNNPIPQNFGGQILQLAIALQKQDPKVDGHWIFDGLSQFVASSVLLDCVRHRKGLPYDHKTDYEDYFDYALEEFCRVHSLCNFENGKGRCVNTQSTHQSKGHQNIHGKVIGTGAYQSSFTFDGYYDFWADSVEREILSCQQGLEELRDQADRTVSDERHALRLHRKITKRFYRAFGKTKDFRSHTVCFSCLMGTPQHSLPCGHVLCTPCVKGFGKTTINSSEFSLYCCPLDSDECSWREAYIISFKPDLAGIRVLSLDGGGIRGIVELEVLHAIQKSLGDGIPIRALFDLIVGTSTGGIIALALSRRWPVKRCIHEFRKLCGQAFTPRPLHSIPILGLLQTFNNGSKYKTKQLHRALQTSLGEDILFGGQREDDMRYIPKVAVTSTNEEGRKAVVIANYNRSIINPGTRKEAKSQCEFPRPDNPSLELKYWEAAAATAAAPPYFKTFYHQATKRSYLDGAFYNNNPARIAHQESKLLWPDVADHCPDIFLSIGTSKDSQQLDKESVNLGKAQRNKTTNSQRPVFLSSRWYQLFNAMHGRMDSILDAEVLWKEFLSSTVNSTTEDRYVRVNPNINYKPPDLDAINHLESLRNDAKAALNRERSTIRNIARSLISTSFYFDMINPPSPEGANQFKCTGQILCRLDGYLRAFGNYFLLQQRPGFQPYFEISEDSYDAPKQQLYLTSEIINRMKEQGALAMSTLDITLSSRTARVNIVLYLGHTGSFAGEASPYPISGFPRSLASEALSGRAPPNHASNSSSHKTTNARRRERRMRASTGSVPITSPQFPRPQASRAFSLPERTRSEIADEPNRALRAELQAPSEQSYRPSLSNFSKEDISRNITPRSSGAQNLPKEALQSSLRWELPTHAEPSERSRERTARDQTHFRHSSTPSSIALGKNPTIDDSRGVTYNEHQRIRQAEARRPNRPPSFQPPPLNLSDISLPSGSRSNITLGSNVNLQDDSAEARTARLRAQRRKRNGMPSELEYPVAPDRPFEISASTKQRPSSRTFVQGRSLLSGLERSLDSQRQRPAFHGYASDEDASQPTYSQVSTNYE